MELIIGAVLLFIVIGVAGYVIGVFNSLVQLKHNIDKSWANIDVILKQRHDEIPKLLETCKGYMKYEQTLLERITQARTAFLNANSIEAKTQAENELAKGLKNLFAVAENYPDLKANQNFLQLQGRVSGLENEISDRGEFFNDSVNLYNIKIDQFPDLLVARTLGYNHRSLLEIPKAETEDVKIKF